MSESNQSGISLDQLDISDEFKSTLTSRSINTVDQLLSAMAIFPSSIQLYCTHFGVDYDSLKNDIYAILPKERIIELETISEQRYALGSLPNFK